MRLLISAMLVFYSTTIFCQTKLKPGFDAKEYISLFSLSRGGFTFSDSIYRNEGLTHKRIYKSPEVGLKNQWYLLERSDNTGIIIVRGTVGDKNSWLANFYAAMIPATGTLHLTDSNQFNYKFSNDPKAAVHVGWTVSLGFMADDILQKLRGSYSKGIKDFYIFGHSQGGAIVFLLTSYLKYLQADGKLPPEITFKTYSSAGPKPGNMNYAYDYDFITRDGWGFNVVNTADWVPETPFTVQRMQDMSEVNPLIHTKNLLKKQNFFVRLVGNYAYGRFNNKPRKLQKTYTKLFGNTLYNRAISKTLTQYQKPEYYQSQNYMRAGTSIVLKPDSLYHQQFKFDENKKDYFVHHHFDAYLYLLKKYYLK